MNRATEALDRFCGGFREIPRKFQSCRELYRCGEIIRRKLPGRISRSSIRMSGRGTRPHFRYSLLDETMIAQERLSKDRPPPPAPPTGGARLKDILPRLAPRFFLTRTGIGARFMQQKGRPHPHLRLPPLNHEIPPFANSLSNSNTGETASFRKWSPFANNREPERCIRGTSARDAILRGHALHPLSPEPLGSATGFRPPALSLASAGSRLYHVRMFNQLSSQSSRY